jgi:ketosteroid isomerase-like protein
MDPKYTDTFLEVVGAAATPDSSDPQTILHRAYHNIIQGDFHSFGEYLSDNVELHICGLGALDGTWRGREEVLAATRRNFAEVADQKPEVEAMIAQGDSIAVLLRESGMFKSSGQTYSVRGVQWFTFAGGKIRKIDEIVASIWKVES